MIEARKCARCGAMYISDTEVCGKCEQKDGADLNKLKGFLEIELGTVWSETDIAQATGIAPKNLSRFLNNDEFKGIQIGNNEIIAVSGKINQEHDEEGIVV